MFWIFRTWYFSLVQLGFALFYSQRGLYLVVHGYWKKCGTIWWKCGISGLLKHVYKGRVHRVNCFVGTFCTWELGEPATPKHKSPAYGTRLICRGQLLYLKLKRTKLQKYICQNYAPCLAIPARNVENGTMMNINSSSETFFFQFSAFVWITRKVLKLLV
jgi:hypothetical protein